MNDRLGTVLVGDARWGYFRSENNVVLLGPADEDVPIRAVAAAAREVKAALAPAKIRPCVRLAPSVRMVLGDDLTRHQLIERFDELLTASLRFLGATDRQIAEWCSYGMPSEYRGWLDLARRHAMKQMVATDFGWECMGERVEESKTRIAEEIVMGTCAVAVSMRHTYATFDFSLASAVKDLTTQMEAARILTSARTE